MTGLATPSYLRTRLGEVYRTAVADNVLVTDVVGLVVLDASVMTPDPWQRLARVCVLADCLRELFAGGESLVALGSGRVAALVARDDDLGPMLARLRTSSTSALVRGGALAGLPPPTAGVAGAAPRGLRPGARAPAGARTLTRCAGPAEGAGPAPSGAI